MIRGTVVGQVWATHKAPGLNGQKLLLVAQPDGQVWVASDVVDAGVGDQVLVSRGSGARNALCPGPDNRQVLCDAAVSLVIEGQSDGRSDGRSDGQSDGQSEGAGHRLGDDPSNDRGDGDGNISDAGPAAGEKS